MAVGDILVMLLKIIESVGERGLVPYEGYHLFGKR